MIKINEAELTKTTCNLCNIENAHIPVHKITLINNKTHEMSHVHLCKICLLLLGKEIKNKYNLWSTIYTILKHY